MINLSNHNRLTKKLSEYIAITAIIPISLCYAHIVLSVIYQRQMHWIMLLALSVAYLCLCTIDFFKALCILILFIPFQLKGIDITHGVLSVTDVMLVGLVFVWLIRKILGRPTIVFSSNCCYLLIWIFFMVLSFANIRVPKLSIGYFLRLLSSVVFFFVVYDETRNYDRFFKMIKVIVLSLLFVSAYGVLEFFVFKRDLPLFLSGQLNGYKRVETFFNQPNVTAFHLVVTIPFIIYFIITENRRLLKILYTGALGVSLSCLTLTFSRAGWLCFTLSILFLPFSKSKKILILTAIISLVLLTVLSVNITSRWPSVLQRIFRYKHAVSQVMQKPFMGHGIRTYKDISEPLHDLKSKAPHSIYLAVAVETGIPALLSFLLLIGCTARRIIVVRNYTRNNITRNKPTFLFASCLLASFVSLFLMGFFQTPLTSLLMWTMLALYNLFPAFLLNTVYKNT